MQGEGKLSMCGRYFINDDTAKEIEELTGWEDEDDYFFQAKDIYPTNTAPILSAENGKLVCVKQKWGFPPFQGSRGQVIFNARCETVREKPTFRDSVAQRRIVVPAAWFYEWNSQKEKHIFRHKTDNILFLAGCYNRYNNEECFVILTTAANSSMKPVHDRMPLILERDELLTWILDGNQTQNMLQKVPCLLDDSTDYEQMSLF